MTDRRVIPKRHFAAFYVFSECDLTGEKSKWLRKIATEDKHGINGCPKELKAKKLKWLAECGEVPFMILGEGGDEGEL